MRGLVSRWKVVPNFVGGSRLVDLCGRNHGTLTNNPKWSSAIGRLGGSGSIRFDGSDDYISIPGVSFPLLGNTFTVAVWFNTTNVTLGQMIFGFDNGMTSQGFELRIHTDGTILAGMPGITRAATTGVMTANIWTHVVVTVNGTGANAHVIYINGQSVALSSNATGTYIDQAASQARLIGIRYAPGGTLPFNGWLDDAIVIPRVYSASEAFLLYNSTRQKYDPTLNYNNFYYPYIYPRYDGRFIASPFDCPIIQGVV